MISFALPKADNVTVNIYNETGQLVRTLVDREMAAERQAASGVYFYQLRAGEFKRVRKMSLVR